MTEKSRSSINLDAGFSESLFLPSRTSLQTPPQRETFFVVHPHLHRRFTGVSRHVASIVPLLALRCSSVVFGAKIQDGLPRLGLRQIWRRAHKQTLIWHAHRNLETLLGWILRWFLPRVILVVTRHSATPASAWTRFLLRRADQVVALSQAGAAQLPCAAQVIGHGVDLEQFSPPQSRRLAWQKLGLDGDRGVAVVGRVQPSKGPQDFVRAITPLLPTYPKLQPLLIGLVKAKHRAWAQKLGAQSQGRLHMAGLQDNMARWYQGLDVVVMPSPSEGFGLVILEAMASGCCVIATALPHLQTLIEHGRTGFLYPPSDVKALQKLLEKLLADPALVDQVGQAAALQAREHYGLEAEVKKLVDLYQQLLSQKALV